MNINLSYKVIFMAVAATGSTKDITNPMTTTVVVN